jgi:hypothetical protein
MEKIFLKAIFITYTIPIFAQNAVERCGKLSLTFSVLWKTQPRNLHNSDILIQKHLFLREKIEKRRWKPTTELCRIGKNVETARTELYKNQKATPRHVDKGVAFFTYIRFLFFT